MFTNRMRMASADPSVLVTPATFNPADAGSYWSFTNGNRTGTASAPYARFGIVRTTYGIATGRVYAEFSIGGNGHSGFGLATASANLNSWLGNDAHGWSLLFNGSLFHAGAGSALGATFGAGDIGGIAVDADAGTAWLRLNGVWIGGGNPATGASPTITGLSGTIYLAGDDPDSNFSVYGASILTINCGQAAFSDPVPTGFASGFGILA